MSWLVSLPPQPLFYFFLFGVIYKIPKARVYPAFSLHLAAPVDSPRASCSQQTSHDSAGWAPAQACRGLRLGECSLNLSLPPPPLKECAGKIGKDLESWLEAGEAPAVLTWERTVPGLMGCFPSGLIQLCCRGTAWG